MNALALMATLGLDSSGYEKGLDESKRSADSFGKSIKRILGGIAIGAAVKKTLDGITAITKGAIDAYKTFEQLEGGAKLIFGKGSYEDYAKKASDSLYKMGQRGEDVLKLQKELIAAGYDLGEAGADGIYGPKTKAALDAYAKAGGQMVKDIYDKQGSAYDFMMDKAEQAFEKVQMSASNYMAQVNGLGTALRESMGGDTQAAVELADKIITAEADVVAAMGISQESVQNAFNGLMRGNYMMLDNLGIGIKGTKTGMEEVITKVNEWNKEQGRSTNYVIGNLADEESALVDYIEMLGYAGYAGREANDTIEGSIASTKAAWQNMLLTLGRGGDVKKAMGNLTRMAKNVLTNVKPIVKNALSGIGEMVRELGPVIIEELPGLVQDLLPDLLGAVGSLMGALGRALPGLLGAIWNGARTALGTFGAWLEEQSPTLGKVFNEVLNIVGRISEDIEAVLNGEKSLGDVIYGWFTDAKEKIEGIDWAATGLYIRDKILEFFKNISNKIQGYLNDARRLIEEINWADVGQWIFDKVSAVISGIAETLKTFFEDGAAAIRDIGWYELGQKIWGWIKAAFTSVGTFLHDLFLGGAESEEADWEGVAKAIYNFLKEALKGVGSFIGGLFSISESDEGNISLYAFDLIYMLNEKLKFWIPTLLKAGDTLLETLLGSITKGTGLEGKENEIAAGLEAIFAAIGSYEAVLKAAEAIKALTAAFAAFKAGGLLAIAGNPVALAIGAVVGALVYFWNTSEEFRNVVGEIWQAIVDLVTDPIGTIKKLIDDSWKAVQVFWKKTEGLRNAIGSIWESISETTERWWKKIAGWIQPAIDLVNQFLSLAGVKIDTTNTDNGAARYKQNYNGNFQVEGTVRQGGGGEFGGAGGGRGGRKSTYVGHASAMENGEILRGLTPFGIDRHGAMHYGGEAGDEAVVGVNSLRGMIQQSVNNALGGLRLQVVLDSGVLVGEIAPQMDTALNDIATWKGGGRAG